MSKMTHPKLPTWGEWLDQATEGETQTEIGERLGVSRATVSRWTHKRVLDPNMILAISRAYKVDPVQGLLASGWLKPSDLNNGGMQYMVSYAPTRMLVNELHQRLGGQ